MRKIWSPVIIMGGERLIALAIWDLLMAKSTINLDISPSCRLTSASSSRISFSLISEAIFSADILEKPNTTFPFRPFEKPIRILTCSEEDNELFSASPRYSVCIFDQRNTSLIACMKPSFSSINYFSPRRILNVVVIISTILKQVQSLSASHHNWFDNSWMPVGTSGAMTSKLSPTKTAGGVSRRSIP